MDIRSTKHSDGITVIEGQENAQDYINFSIIPTWIMKHPGLSANDKLVYALIFSFNTNSKEFFGSNEFIGSSLNLSARSVANMLGKLEKLDLISRSYNNDNPAEGRTHIRTLRGYHSTVTGVSSGNDRGVSLKNEHTNIDITNKDTNIISKDIRKKLPDPQVSDLIDYFKEKLGTSLDGTVKDNRQYCYNLVRKIKKDYPDKDPVKAIKVLIDVGLKDDFHAKNTTGFKYIYYNTQKIISSYQSRSKSNLVII